MGRRPSGSVHVVRVRSRHAVASGRLGSTSRPCCAARSAARWHGRQADCGDPVDVAGRGGGCDRSDVEGKTLIEADAAPCASCAARISWSNPAALAATTAQPPQAAPSPPCSPARSGHRPHPRRYPQSRRGRKPATWTRIDQDYEALRVTMQTLFHDLGITTGSAAAQTTSWRSGSRKRLVAATGGQSAPSGANATAHTVSMTASRTRVFPDTPPNDHGVRLVRRSQCCGTRGRFVM
jgi:hypothetical protein